MILSGLLLPLMEVAVLLGVICLTCDNVIFPSQSQLSRMLKSQGTFILNLVLINGNWKPRVSDSKPKAFLMPPHGFCLFVSFWSLGWVFSSTSRPHAKCFPCMMSFIFPNNCMKKVLLSSVLKIREVESCVYFIFFFFNSSSKDEA